jgi:hypothetical protein
MGKRALIHQLNETVMKVVIEMHPEVRKAIASVNDHDQKLKGLYWREAVIEKIAESYHTNGPYKGKVTEAALDYGEMMMSEYENSI